MHKGQKGKSKKKTAKSGANTQEPKVVVKRGLSDTDTDTDTETDADTQKRKVEEEFKFEAESLEIHFLDVGQGDCILILVKGHDNDVQKAILMDGGIGRNAPMIDDYLRKESVKFLDKIIATHYDEDHIEGLVKLFSNVLDLISQKQQVNCVTKDTQVFDPGFGACSTNTGNGLEKFGKCLVKYEENLLKLLASELSEQQVQWVTGPRRETQRIKLLDLHKLVLKSDNIIIKASEASEVYTFGDEITGILKGNLELSDDIIKNLAQKIGCLSRSSNGKKTLAHHLTKQVIEEISFVDRTEKWLVNKEILNFTEEKEDGDHTVEPNMCCIAANQWIAGGQSEPVKITDTSLDSGSRKNQCSLAFHLRFGTFEAYLGGDIGQLQEKAMFQKYQNNITLMKISHHGSKHSTPLEFVQRVKPTVAVISCGFNENYKHPYPCVLDILEKQLTLQNYFLTNPTPLAKYWKDAHQKQNKLLWLKAIYAGTNEPKEKDDAMKGLPQLDAETNNCKKEPHTGHIVVKVNKKDAMEKSPQFDVACIKNMASYFGCLKKSALDFDDLTNNQEANKSIESFFSSITTTPSPITISFNQKRQQRVPKEEFEIKSQEHGAFFGFYKPVTQVK